MATKTCDNCGKGAKAAGPKKANSQKLRLVKIRGYKSIEESEIELGDLNVVIGANGSGKSNLIGAFSLLEQLLARSGPPFAAHDPDRLLHHGRKVTPDLSMAFEFDRDSYGFRLQAERDRLLIASEWVGHRDFWDRRGSIGDDRVEGHPGELDENGKMVVHNIAPFAKGMKVYQFHDTSGSSPMRTTANMGDNRFFRPDAANLPAYLYWLKVKHPFNFRHIEDAIRTIAPFFECFILEPDKLSERMIKLEWKHKDSDAYFDAWYLSDGTLRFVCLATLLLQPEPPKVILIDEPELGLHPAAIWLLAEMLELAASRSQVIVATQSATLLDHFACKDVIVAEHDRARTSFKRLREEDLKHWLERYSLGELWQKNLLGGNP